jgi:hypothetical protein
MASDYQMIRKGVNSIGDYQRLQEEFEIKKQLAQADLMKAQSGGNLPAALQIADAYAQARASGDTQRMNDIALAAKSFDKGVVYDQNGNPVAMTGYGDAVGSIAGTKRAYEAQAQNASDLQYDPLIAGGEAQQRQAQELRYAGPIADATNTATNAAARAAKRQDEYDTNEKILPAVDSLRELNDQSPTIPYAGKTQWMRRLIPGTSPEEAAVDLMKQRRLELAAPLAKQLGVNPTDKDFQATLDRIFDIEASKPSRAQQIEALGGNITNRQKQLDPMAASRAAVEQRAQELGGNQYQTLPEQPVSDDKEGDTATGPDGTRMIFTKGKWRKL